MCQKLRFDGATQEVSPISSSCINPWQIAWVFYDNSVPPLPRLVAVGRLEEVLAVHDGEIWKAASAWRPGE